MTDIKSLIRYSLPPASPSKGAMVRIGLNAKGSFERHDMQTAYYTGDKWVFMDDDAYDALQSQGWQTMDKLPSEDGRYWVYSKWDNGNGWLGYARYFAGHWECVDDGFHPDDNKITHWQYLPAPPTTGEGV